MSWNLGAEKVPLSFLLLGIVDGRVVIENNKQEERHTQHVGKDGELHIREHAYQWGSAPDMVCTLTGGRKPGLEVCSALHSFFIHSFFFFFQSGEQNMIYGDQPLFSATPVLTQWAHITSWPQ